MEQICQRGRRQDRVTPLCNNWDLYHNLKNISDSVWVDFRLMLGMTLIESHIGTAFAPSYEQCASTNNWAGIKWDYERNRNWKEWCWLHQFDTIEAFWYSFARSLKRGYIDKWCDTASCIARRRVRGDWVLEWKENWIRVANTFM